MMSDPSANFDIFLSMANRVDIRKTEGDSMTDTQLNMHFT